MAENRFLKERKGLFIRGKFLDKEKLIKVAKSQAKALGLKGKIVVLDLGNYNPEIEGQAVVVESLGSGYNTPGSGSKSLRR
ncbi:MAG: hypothetical protein OEY81_04160 [Candidatus Bathyarchaeota archaeon]|nr:hypothetical protein [Candidatus Bathyarchaeota archaeon]